MKLNLAPLLRGVVKIATPIVIAWASQKVERQAEKLTRPKDKL